MKFTPKSLDSQIHAIARASDHMHSGDASRWHRRLEMAYGDMEGQRRVDFSLLAGELEPRQTIIALESVYYLLSVLISTSAFDRDPAKGLRDRSRTSYRSFDSFLVTILDGTVYDELGIHGCRDTFPLGWIGDCDQVLRSELRELFKLVARCWDGTKLKLAGDDPLQEVHRQLFPVDLMHITGQFYSPEWLAELCIADVGWQPDQTLLDPFCGSGVFLVKALRVANDAGADPRRVLPKIGGIDINPFAAAATRANLALFLARCAPAINDPVTLKIECADAIGPSLASAKQNNPSGKLDDAENAHKADVVATNPPWVGWEYLSRPYREQIEPAWRFHDLFTSSGLEASFLKEDLSNLALLAAWDAYLRDGGRSVVVLRPSTMHSQVASRGVRRLSLREGGTKLNLQRIRTFDGMRLFKSASTPAATWIVQKGTPTQFPVPVTQLEKTTRGWNPAASDSLAEIKRHVREVDKLAEPTELNDAASRWMIVPKESIGAMRQLRGANDYKPRMGVFTGGANGVFYLEPAPNDSAFTFRNVTTGSKRKVAQTEFDVESELVHSVARGRDITMWRCAPQLFLLMPHTPETRIYPIPRHTLTSRFPQTSRYFDSMKQVLESRKGFAGWEKKIHHEFFYALQRIGSYTFAPYKVAWRYIASEFIVCVIENDDNGKAIVPNDKVMFIPLESADDAYFVAGFLSSDLVRRYVGCVMEKRQVSTRVIQSLAIPNYDRECLAHQKIGDRCRIGHEELRRNSDADVTELRLEIDQLVQAMCLTPA